MTTPSQRVEVLHRNPYWSYGFIRSSEPGVAPYFLIDVPESVLCIATTTKSEVLLVSQYRPALGTATLEFPGGGTDLGETPIVAAVRELREETGLVPTQPPRAIAVLAPSTGCSSERCHVVVLADVNPAAAIPERGLDLRWVSHDDVIVSLLAAQPADAIALAAWTAYACARRNP